jgi:MFS family permease
MSCSKLITHNKARWIILTMTESSEAITDVFKPNFQFLAAFSSLAIVSLAAALDATIIAVALPVGWTPFRLVASWTDRFDQIISTDIHGSATQAFWAGTSFLLASTVLMLDWVAFSHVFGRRIIMFITCGSFALGSILCAVSHNFTLMLVGRTIQGAGAGGFVAVVQVIITDMVPLRQRAKYYALLSTVYAVGSIAGPIVGGALAQHGAWRVSKNRVFTLRKRMLI